MDTNFNTIIIHIRQIIEATQVPISGWVDKQKDKQKVI